ncbi:MAG: DUF5615 family PIN-like protein [Bacteroidota bacterium]
MKYVVYAQLPKRLKAWLVAYGVEAKHTLDFPAANRTSDLDIAAYADRGGLIVISKDSDYLPYRIVKGTPDKLLMITTGNIVNSVLLPLFEANFPEINRHFQEGRKVVELSNTALTVHE